MRRLTSCGSRGAETNPPVHRRSVPFWIQYASRSVFPRSLSSAVHDCRVGTVRPDLLVRSGARWVRLCIAERFGAGDITVAVAAGLWSRHLLHAVQPANIAGLFD